jgi:enoyl-CoA hydratase/carnithine racemase
VIVTGAGRAFCAGADLSAGGNTFNADGRADRPSGLHRDGGGLLTLRIYDSLKPVIAAVNGPAVGIGATMTLAMDIRIASEAARFGFVFARRGIVPEACSSWFLPRAVGISKALEWTYSGRVFPVEEAKEARLVSRVVPHEELLPTARALAREIADNTSAISVTLIRHMMWRMLGADHPMEAHKLDSRGVYYTGRSPDAREGVESFLEKRAAKFPGKVSKDMPEFFPWWEPRQFE